MTGRGRGRRAGIQAPLERMLGRGGGMRLGLGRGKGQGRNDCGGMGRGKDLGAHAAADSCAETTTRPPMRADRADRGVTAVVSADKCLSCGICVDFCPEHALAMAEIVIVDPGRCTGCGSCIAVCANRALSLQGTAPMPVQDLAR